MADDDEDCLLAAEAFAESGANAPRMDYLQKSGGS